MAAKEKVITQIFNYIKEQIGISEIREILSFDEQTGVITLDDGSLRGIMITYIEPDPD
jgi:predicted KAP-like P-loop ATPase